MSSKKSKFGHFKQPSEKIAYNTRPGPAVIEIPATVVVENNSPEVTKNGNLDPEKSTNSPCFKCSIICTNLYKKSGLKHLGLLIVTVGYACFGGFLFSFLEYENEIETKLKKRTYLNDVAKEIALNVSETISAGNFSTEDIQEILYRKIIDYQRNASLVPSEKIMWDFWGGMFFAGTVFTTIGYGHYSPVTTAGRIAVMLYALIGIPMVLAMLTDFGKLLTQVLNKMWSSFRNGLSKITRCLIHRDIVTAERVDSFDFPIPLAIGFIVAWIFACAALFRLWEKSWTYLDAFYFFFISLSTIGLGDITPEHPKYLICNFPLVIIGLSLVSLVINLIQNKLEKLKDKTTGFVEDQFGFSGNESSASDSDDDSINKVDESFQKVEMNQRINLGIMQTLQKVRPKKRKRTGVQTEESYFRDTVLQNGDCKQKLENNFVQKEPILSNIANRIFRSSPKSPKSDAKNFCGSLETIFYDAQ